MAPEADVAERTIDLAADRWRVERNVERRKSHFRSVVMPARDTWRRSPNEQTAKGLG